MKIIAIIPARFASQRLHAKPLADILGKTMIERVYLQVKKAKLVDDVFVATDDEKIFDVVKDFGGKVIMTPSSIESGSDRIAFASKEIDADYILNVQGDEPLIAPELIDEVIELMLKDNKAEVGTAVKKINSQDEIFNPNIVKAVLDKNSYALYFSRSPIPFQRDLIESEWLHNSTFYKHFGIYIYKKEILNLFSSWQASSLEKSEKLEQLRFLENGIKIKAVETNCDSVAVDTIEDLEKVRKILLSN